MKNKDYHSPRISSEFKDCALPLTFDQYTKCAFGCQYCFGVQFKKCNPAVIKSPELGVVNTISLSKVIRGEKPDNPYYQNFYSKRFVFHWGGMTEPFDHIEKTRGAGLILLKTLADLKYPTLFSTKGLSMFLKEKELQEYRDIFENNKEYKNFAFQFSIITNDDGTSLKIEPNTPITSERLEAMKIISDMGYYTILRLRPFIIGISDIGLEELLTRAKEAGAKAISTEFFALDERVVPQLKERLEVISSLTGIPTRDFYKKLSPSSRGTYMRLTRDVKEPFMKRLYSKCKELGLSVGISDPDFKELNDTGCCCGLPEVYPENPELTNWSRGQLTYHLKELRKRYWASKGEDKYLRFEDVQKTIHNNWMNEYRYYGDSIKYWQIDYAQLKTGHIREFITSWNRLDSSDSPYNYFHGKIKPVKVENEKLVYEYIPSNYELRWMKEGIL